MGSGSWQIRVKPYTSELHCLDVNFLKREKCLEQGTRVRITFSGTRVTMKAYSEYIEIDQPCGSSQMIAFVFRNQHFGGRRTWLECPECKSGAVKLYLSVNARFICRKCSNAKYVSQNLVKYQRHHRNRREMEKIITDAGGSFTSKPKHMHWKTYESLKRKIEHERLQIGLSVFRSQNL